MKHLKKSRSLLVFTLIVALFTTNVSVYADEDNNSTQEINDLQSSLFREYKIDVVEDDHKDAHLEIELKWNLEDETLNVIETGSYYEVILPESLINVKLKDSDSGIQLVENKLRVSLNLKEKITSGTILLSAQLSDSFLDQDNLILDLSSISKEFEPFRILLPMLDDKDETHLELPVKISRFTLKPESSEDTYYSGEEILMYVGMSLGRDSGTMNHATLEIKIPKTYLDVDSIIISDMNSKHDKSVRIEDDFVIIQYWNFPVASGVSMDLPFKFKMLNGKTPDKHSLNIEATLKNDSDQSILAETMETITLQTQSLILTSRINNNLNGRDSVGGLESKSNPGYLSLDLNELSFVKFTYQLAPNVSNTWGNREFEKLVIEYQLPEEAFFSQEDNRNWSYDEKKRTVTYIDEPQSPIVMGSKSKSSTEPLNLKFPNGEIDSMVEGTLKITGYQKDIGMNESPLIWETPVTFRLKADIPTVQDPINFYKYGAGSYFDAAKSKEKVGQWRIRLNNSAQATPNNRLRDVIIRDYNLDSNLKYTGLQFDSDSLNGFDGRLNIDVISKDQTRTRVKSNWHPTGKEMVPFQNVDIDSVEISFTEGSFLEGGKNIEFYVLTEFRDTSANLISQQESRRALHNYAAVTGRFQNGQMVSKSSSDTLTIMKVDPSVGIQKEVDKPQISYFLNDTVSYKLKIRGTMLDNMQSLDNLTVVDFIPQGMRYVEGSGNVKFYNTVESNGNIKSEPTVIPNYKNSGKTALIWNLETVEHTGLLSTSLATISEISYQLQIGRMTTMGDNENEAFLTWTNSDVIKPYQSNSNNMNVTDDIYNLNLNHEGKIANSRRTIRYIATREVILTQRVRGNLDQHHLLPPGEARTEQGKDISYLLSVFNNSEEPIDAFTLLKVFPTTGQLSVSEAALDRSLDSSTFYSDMTLRLTEPVSVPEGFIVLYTQDAYTNDERDFVREAHWQQSLDDYTLATAIKIELKGAMTLSKVTNIDFEIKLHTIGDYEEGSRALSSYAIATTPTLDFFESNISEVRYVKYNVNGLAFEDTNRNGAFDTSDVPIPNLNVKLVDKNLKPVLDPWCKVYETQTDSLGKYSLPVYTKGDYRIIFEMPDGYHVSDKNTDVNGSNINHKGISDWINLSEDRMASTVNGGFYVETSHLTISNKLLDTDQKVYFNNDNFIYRILINGKPYIGPYIKKDIRDPHSNQEMRTDSGLVFFNSKESIEILGLTQGMQYEVEVLANDAYIPTPLSRVLKGAISHSHHDVTFVHSLRNLKTNYTVIKKWQGGPALKPDIHIQLYRNDIAYGKPITLGSGMLEYQWQDLPLQDEFGDKYRYRVDEVNVPHGYQKSVYENIITNTYKEEIMSYEAKMIWVNSPKIKPVIKLQLMQNNIPYGDIVEISNEMNQYQWHNIPKEDYEGNPHEYHVIQVGEYPDYKTSLYNNLVVNTYIPKLRDYTVSSQWLGGFKQKPDIEVQLLQNEEPFGNPVWFKDGLSHYTWSYLPINDKNGDVFEYRIEVLTYLPGYQRNIQGSQVTHRYTHFDIDVSEMTPEELQVWLNGKEGSNPNHLNPPFDPRNSHNPYVLGANKSPYANTRDTLPNTGIAARIQSLGFELTLVGIVLYFLSKWVRKRD
ncbi:MAG: Cna B-type domain-containing protein [Erysipelothrix sp.]